MEDFYAQRFSLEVMEALAPNLNDWMMFLFLLTRGFAWGPRWAFRKAPRSNDLTLTSGGWGLSRVIPGFLTASHQATTPPCHDFAWSLLAICHRIATPRICMVIPVNLPNRHAMVPPVENWSPTGANPVNRQTDRHTHTLIKVAPA